MIPTENAFWFVDRCARAGFVFGGTWIVGQWVHRILASVVFDESAERDAA